MVITLAVLLLLLLEVFQLCLVHHLLHQVLLPTHALTQALGHVRDQVCNEGLDPIHQVLRVQCKPCHWKKNFSTILYFSLCEFMDLEDKIQYYG